MLFSKEFLASFFACAHWSCAEVEGAVQSFRFDEVGTKLGLSEKFGVIQENGRDTQNPSKALLTGTGSDKGRLVLVRDGWLPGAREIGPGAIFRLSHSRIRKLAEFDGFFTGAPNRIPHRTNFDLLCSPHRLPTSGLISVFIRQAEPPRTTGTSRKRILSL